MQNRTSKLPKKFQSYSSSPLGQLLNELLIRLKNITEAYPDKKDAIEHHRAFMFIKLLDALVYIAHSVLLPPFDKGSVPGSVGLVAVSARMALCYETVIDPLSQLLDAEEMFYINLIDFLLNFSSKNKQRMLDFETIKACLERKKTTLFDFDGFFITPKKILTSEEADSLFNKALKQIEALKKWDEDADRIDLAFLPSNLILDRVPKHPISYTLLAELTILFKRLPGTFSELVSFLKPEFLPQLLLATTLTKNKNIKDVEILSGEQYRYKIINQTDEGAVLSSHQDNITDFSESYCIITGVMSCFLSACRRYYLSHLAENDNSGESRTVFFQEIELQEVKKNDLLEQQLMETYRKMEQERDAIIESLPDPDLPVNIDTIKVYLTVHVKLSAYIKTHQDKTLKQFPKVILLGNITEMNPFFPSEVLSRMVYSAQEDNAALLKQIRNRLGQKYNIYLFNRDRQTVGFSSKSIETRISCVQDKLRALNEAQENAKRDHDIILAHLRALNLNEKECVEINNQCLYVLNSAGYEQVKSFLIEDLASLELQQLQLSLCNFNIFKNELDLIEMHINQLQSTRLSASSGDKPASSFVSRISKVRLKVFARAGFTRRLAMSSSLEHNIEEYGEVLAAERETAAALMLQLSLDHQKALKQLYSLSFAFDQLNEALKVVSSNCLPTIKQLSQLYQAHLNLSDVIMTMDSIEYRDFLLSLRKQHEASISSPAHVELLKHLEKQYRSLLDLDKQNQFLTSCKQQHREMLINLSASIRVQMLPQYTRLDQQHTQLLMDYSALRTNMWQKTVDEFSQQLTDLSDKIRRFEKNRAKFQKYAGAYLDHPLLVMTLQLDFSVPVLPFSVETLQAMKPRQHFVAQRLQILIDSTPSSRQYLISQLHTQLHHYIETGNNLEAIIQWMQVKLAVVVSSDIRFKTRWHQVHLGFWEEKYNAQAYAVDDLSAKIDQMKEKNLSYSQSLGLLYQMLQSMRPMSDDSGDEATAMFAFIDGCMQDMAMLVDKKIPFEDFQKKFLIRLHSQDELMQRKNTQEMWRYWVANLLVGLLTAGTALALQWTYTRLSEGSGRFFFDKTQKEQCIQNIEKHLQYVIQP